MAVFRVERNKGYTVMSNHHLRKEKWNGAHLRGKRCYSRLTPTKKWVIYDSKSAAYNISIKLIEKAF